MYFDPFAQASQQTHAQLSYKTIFVLRDHGMHGEAGVNLKWVLKTINGRSHWDGMKKVFVRVNHIGIE